MAELKIKSESLAARCEVCHQVDRFNAETGHCSRCAGLSITIAGIDLSSIAKSPTITDIELGAFVGLAIGLVLGIGGGAYLFSYQGGVMGAIIGVMCLAPVWMIQGAIIALIVGRSARLTDTADFTAVSKAININKAIDINNGAARNYVKTVKAALMGLGLAIPALLLFEESILLSLQTVVWAALGLANGAAIETLCRNRSDRRERRQTTEIG